MYDRAVLAALLVASAFAAPASTTIDVPDSGRIVRVGDFPPEAAPRGDIVSQAASTPIRRNAIKAYGKPGRQEPAGLPEQVEDSSASA